jgi:hypothetical protein
LLWLAAPAIKAQDELAALGFDGRLASHKSPDIRAKENIRYELTQPQNNLTATGLLMEAQVVFPALADLETCSGDLSSSDAAEHGSVPGLLTNRPES